MDSATLDLSRVAAAIVDLDGTMVDTVGDFEQALARTLAELALPPVDRAFIARTVGRGSMHLLAQTLAHAGGAPELLEAAWVHYQRHYAEINGRHADVYPGVREGLAAMRARGWHLACVTNKPRAFALALLEAKGLSPSFEHVFGGDSFERQKPDPLPLVKTCEALGTRARADADGGRFAQRLRGRARRRLPGGAGELRLQPRRAGGRRAARPRSSIGSTPRLNRGVARNEKGGPRAAFGRRGAASGIEVEGQVDQRGVALGRRLEAPLAHRLDRGGVQAAGWWSSSR